MTSTPTNGSLSPSLLDDDNEHKKQKLDARITPPAINGTQQATTASINNINNNNHSLQQQQVPSTPSRVVHIRNIPLEATENDIIAIGHAFGKVTNVLLLKGKNQAFLEFSDVVFAQTMVSYWQTACNPPTIKGRNVFVQFSNHKELKTNDYQTASTSPSPDQQHNSNNNNDTELVFTNNGNSGSVNSSSSSSSNTSPVLRVIIDHMIYPVTLETLYSIFSRYGKITKIVTFTKSGTFQALIQFESSLQATTAKLSLDGHQMYPTGNLLKIEYSKLQQLNVKYNNDKSRDFTNPLLPPGNTSNAAATAAAATNAGANALSALTFNSFNHHDSLASLDPLGLAGKKMTVIFFRLFNIYLMIIAFQQQPFGLTTSFASLRAALSSSSHHSSPSSQSLLSSALGYGSVLLVSNLNEEMATPDALFTLFGVYGDVIRVKILFNKKDNALVQMLDPQQAQLAMNYLDKQKVFGKVIKISPSKHQLVQLPKEGQPDSGLTKDYTNSALHRFKKPGSKNYLNIYPPSSTLHLSNIPPSVDEEQIKEAFRSVAGVNVLNFKFFPKDRKMALIQLNSIEDAITALIKMHNYQLSESNHLRVSFSKSSI
ncbi:polypyrimidine tract-binding protein 1-like protein [Dinothrombium tinctorium]|uniref:Polypyrimidine tract-binding protein 1-like protein n=1 Tax=Dinothrombium tinctorium TaxID=1965070 RepID=A0A3S4RHY1_9ACAR|nr:polypyrimidine tract-binding protein 1-like protein [Dinothrombium tinctorium]